MGLIKKVIIVFVILSIIAGFMIVKDKENEDAGMVSYVVAYAKWAGNVVKNVGSLTASVIKMDWLPQS